MTAHDLLTEPLLSWRDSKRRRGATTLPGALAKLASGELADFPAAQAHQLEPWSMFLTQLAAISLHRSGTSDPALAEDTWRSLLLELTAGEHEPWCLLVGDLSKPAFLQPPVPEQTLEGWKGWVDHPDDMDVLVTAKAHDVKPSRISGADAESWVFAVVTLQTMQGYPGRGYYGISRMKGGYGSRPRVGNSPDLSLPARFRHDVDVLCTSWDDLLDRGFSERGASLTWTLPWDGTRSLGFNQLAPHFVEVCQRIRLVESPTGIVCRYSTSGARRCLALETTGDVGDPWIPIERKDRGALTVGRRGFNYELLTRILFSGDFAPAAAQVIGSSGDEPLIFLASVMARGQGKTDGLHNRTLQLPREMRRRLGRIDTRDALEQRARSNVQQAKDMRSKVLFPALKKIALGEKTVADEFDRRVDEVFFDELFGNVALGDNEAALSWQKRLQILAWAELQGAIDRCSLPSATWYRSVADAEGIFRGLLKKQFPTLAADLRNERNPEQPET